MEHNKMHKIRYNNQDPLRKLAKEVTTIMIKNEATEYSEIQLNVVPFLSGGRTIRQLLAEGYLPKDKRK